MRPIVSRPSQRSVQAPVRRAAPVSASLTTPTDEQRGVFDWEQPPGDEPGTLADVMDGSAQQDPQQEEDQKIL